MICNMVIFTFSQLGTGVLKCLALLYQPDEFKRMFPPAPFASFHFARALRNYLLRGKVYPAGKRLNESRNV